MERILSPPIYTSSTSSSAWLRLSRGISSIKEPHEHRTAQRASDTQSHRSLSYLRQECPVPQNPYCVAEIPRICPLSGELVRSALCCMNAIWLFDSLASCRVSIVDSVRGRRYVKYMQLS